MIWINCYFFCRRIIANCLWFCFFVFINKHYDVLHTSFCHYNYPVIFYMTSGDLFKYNLWLRYKVQIFHFLNFGYYFYLIGVFKLHICQNISHVKRRFLRNCDAFILKLVCHKQVECQISSTLTVVLHKQLPKYLYVCSLNVSCPKH